MGLHIRCEARRALSWLAYGGKGSGKPGAMRAHARIGKGRVMCPCAGIGTRVYRARDTGRDRHPRGGARYIVFEVGLRDFSGNIRLRA